MHHHKALALLDHIWEHRKYRRETRVTIGEYFCLAALSPHDLRRCVDRRFDVRAIEVHGSLSLGKRSPSSTTLDGGLKGEEGYLRETQYIP